MCAEVKNANENTGEHVPDFSVVGFTSGAAGAAGDRLVQAHAEVPDLKALKLAACVGASYNSSTNQICFSVPIYGNVCITSPISIPVSAEIRACVETCGRLIPTGLKGTIYVNGGPIWSGTIIGSC